MLNKNSEITHIAMVHSETTSGSINPINEIGKLIKAHNKNVLKYILKLDCIYCRFNEQFWSL